MREGRVNENINGKCVWKVIAGNTRNWDWHEEKVLVRIEDGQPVYEKRWRGKPR